MIDWLKGAFESLIAFLVSLAEHIVHVFQVATEWIFGYLVPWLKDIVVWFVDHTLGFATAHIEGVLEAFQALGEAGAMMGTAYGFADTFFDVGLVMMFLGTFIMWEISIVCIKIAVKLFPAVY